MMTMLRHRTALQLALLLTVGAVIALCLAALACGPRRPACRGLTAQTCRGYYHRGSCKSARQAGTNPKGSHASMGSQFSLGPLRK